MRRNLPSGLLLLVTLTTSAWAVDSSALINEAMDRTVKLQVDGVLPQVLKAIEDQTNVPIKAGPAVYDLLPWGDQTNVSARIENQTLRQALTAITRKLGLTWELGAAIDPGGADARAGAGAALDRAGTGGIGLAELNAAGADGRASDGPAVGGCG